MLVQSCPGGELSRVHEELIILVGDWPSGELS